MRDIDDGHGIVGEDLECPSGYGAFERAAGEQRRQRTFQSAQVDNLTFRRICLP